MRGGGVLIAVSNRFASRRNLCTHDELEQLWVNINCRGSSICIGVIYLSPDYSNDSFTVQKHIDSALEISCSLQPHATHLLFGDYNQPGITWTRTSSGYAIPNISESTFSGTASALLDGMSLLNMLQMCTVTNDRIRTLDLLFVNEESAPDCTVVEACEPLLEMDSHHPPLLVTQAFPQPVDFDDTPEDREFNFVKADFIALMDSLQEINWETALNHAMDVNLAVERLSTILLQLFSLHVPAPRPRPKPPWSNQRLKKLKRLRAKALRRYTHQRNPLTKRDFTQASNNYRAYNRILYSQHILRVQSNLRRNPKGFWAFVNEKRKESGLPSQMVLEGEIANTRDGICNLFAKHFSSAFNASPASAVQVENALQNVPNNVMNLGNVRFIDDDIMLAIKKLKSSMIPGPDGIPASVFKKCATALCAPLKLIFNQSLAQGVFPER
ncbi:uncharacterized protein LOC129719849 [Wyeomyia smithii]|uniref:uncharacterized protein LOC129719849 n=1 Tax=Wyeomyia smithii TaxID=174621 RepID=UPI00246803BA|nr:uncharacterized protein LOC129719849 [Wyeomyia smithii]